MSRVTRVLFFFLAIVLVGCDHATKFEATKILKTRAPLDLVSGILDLRYTENHDTAFSALERFHFAGKSTLILALSLFVLAGVLARWIRRRQANGIEQAGYAFVASGAIGNLVDRIAHGFVVDFIHLSHWPVFNVADVAIVLGVILLTMASRSRNRASVTENKSHPSRSPKVD